MGILVFLTARYAQVDPSHSAAAKSGAKGSAARAYTPVLPGMPPILEAGDVYAADRPGNLNGAVQNFPPRVYVPNSKSNSVTVIDPATFQVIDRFPVGRVPQHVTPSYDSKILLVLNDKGNSLTCIDPETGKPKKTILVNDPYNMYYTPDGRFAIVVAEQQRRLNFLDAADMKLYHSLQVPCKGVDHMDFSADGRYLIASCEFDGSLVKVDVERQQVLGRLPLARHCMPQDVKLSPDGSVFFVADMDAGGVHLIDGDHLGYMGFIPTGKGAHGLYVSRDSRVLYVSNRGEGSVSVIDFGSRKEVAKWKLPGGGSPDMGGVSADGKVLWLAGRYNSEVYAIDTRDGKLLARIPVGREPWSACTRSPGVFSATPDLVAFSARARW
jgi:YVTN family beta-propeller protein